MENGKEHLSEAGLLSFQKKMAERITENIKLMPPNLRAIVQDKKLTFAEKASAYSKYCNNHK